MANYAKPDYPPEIVNKAGKKLLAFQKDVFIELGDALDVIDNYRAAHAYPAQVMYVTVKRRAEAIADGSYVAQRIKRMPSIIDKLAREPDMKLSQMQDIAGVRAVMKDISQVRALQQELTACRWSHTSLAPKDYIWQPKSSGYRGVHLKYRFVGEGQKSVYNGLKIEVQLRTRLQHQWATSVEAADIFTRQSLKASRGSPEWKRFFALMGSIFALKEKQPLVPGTPSTYEDLAQEILELDHRHHIAASFAGYATMITKIEGDSGGAQYFLVTLDPAARRARIKAFPKEQASIAQRAYTEAEQALPKGSLTQIVLVSTSSIRALKRVYPNYFLDTTGFLTAVNEVLGDAMLGSVASSGTGRNGRIWTQRRPPGAARSG